MTPESAPPKTGPDLDAARALTLAALVVYAVVAALLLGLAAVLANAVFLGFGVLPLLFLALAWFLIHRPLQAGDEEAARIPALTLGVFSLFFGGLIPGVLLLVAYAKLRTGVVPAATGREAPPPEQVESPAGDVGPAVRPAVPTEEAGPPEAPAAPPATRCPSCAADIPAGSRSCPQCGQAL